MTKQDQLNLVDRDSQFSNTESKINCQNNSSDNRQRSKGHSNLEIFIKNTIVRKFSKFILTLSLG